MTNKYRIKILTSHPIFKLFPNALVFVTFLSPLQYETSKIVVSFLRDIGVFLEITESK
jgi:hypothetical protein